MEVWKKVLDNWVRAGSTGSSVGGKELEDRYKCGCKGSDSVDEADCVFSDDDIRRSCRVFSAILPHIGRLSLRGLPSGAHTYFEQKLVLLH